MKRQFAIGAVLIGTLILSISAFLPQVFASRRWIPEGIEFEAGSSVLKPGSDSDLQKMLAMLKNEPSLSIEIQSHTVPGKSKDDDQALSQQRAQRVKNWLVGRGVESGRITIVGYGSSRPLVENTTAKGRSINERIEIIKTYSTFPVAELDEKLYTFDPVPEGSNVLHDFRIQNTGDAILEISEVKTG